MQKLPVDLSSHLNKTTEHGEADFDISLKPIGYLKESSDVIGEGDFYEPIENRFAIVRQDTGKVLSVVSDRYTVVEHRNVLTVVRNAFQHLDVGPTPSGIFVDRGGARMRALFKFPALAQRLNHEYVVDTLCPCIKIVNTYDGTSRVIIHIGAFRFVCTNLAVGGGGSFASGFMSIHAGQIPLELVEKQAAEYLTSFDRIIETYRRWIETDAQTDEIAEALSLAPKTHRQEMLYAMPNRGNDHASVYEAYNVATDYATHRLRTANSAFELLGIINAGFQREFPENRD